MYEGMVRLKWQVDAQGYELVERTWDHPADKGTYIVPRSGKLKTYDIGVREEDVFIELVNTPATPEGVLSFVNKRGLLTKVPEPEISWFYRNRNELRRAVDLGLDNRLSKLQTILGEKGIARLDARLERRRQHAPQLIFRCYTLRQFCWLELVQIVSGGADIVRCAGPGCGNFLPLHKKGRPPKHCSNGCKQASYRERRAS